VAVAVPPVTSPRSLSARRRAASSWNAVPLFLTVRAFSPGFAAGRCSVPSPGAFALTGAVAFAAAAASAAFAASAAAASAGPWPPLPRLLLLRLVLDRLLLLLLDLFCCRR
jgi:hypothetical protein